MVVEKIAEMFAELGFKVDTRGLVAFENHLAKLKRDYAGVSSATIRYTDQTLRSDRMISNSSRNRTNSLIADRRRLARATATTASSIDSMFGIDRGRSPLADHYASVESADQKAAAKAAAKAAREKAAADREAARAANQHERALSSIVRRMSPLQYEYEQLQNHQNLLNREMVEGTGDARRYEASLARIQTRMRQLDGMRGADGTLPFREQRDPVGRPRRSGIGVSSNSGLFGAFGAVAVGIGTNRLQIQQEETEAKMGMVLSEEDTATQIKFASDNARALGTNAVAAAAGYANLMVQATRMGVPLEDTQNLFMGVSEASVAMGLSMDQQKGVYKAFSDMLAKGTVNAEELKGQLGDRLPGAVKLAADSMEITSQELMKMMENNELLAKDFLPKFAIALRASVREGDALNKMMKGTQAQMGRFGNAINDAALAFSRGGFNKAFLEFLHQATKTMNAMVKVGFFDALGFGFRMLMMPIRAVMEVIEALSIIFKKASDEGGVYKDTLVSIAAVIGILLLPALLSIGRALAPFLLMTAGLLALGDIMQGLAGNTSEFKTNWEALTESIKNGKTDWEAFSKVASELGVVLAGILATAVVLRKLNLSRLVSRSTGTRAARSAATRSAARTSLSTTVRSVAGSTVGKVAGIAGLAFGADKLGEGSDNLYNEDGTIKKFPSSSPEELEFARNKQAALLAQKSNNFDRNSEMVSNTNNIRDSYDTIPVAASSKSVIISNMNINGESAPEGIRDNMESYMSNLLGDMFADAMRETIR